MRIVHFLGEFPNIPNSVGFGGQFKVFFGNQINNLIGG